MNQSVEHRLHEESANFASKRNIFQFHTTAWCKRIEVSALSRYELWPCCVEGVCRTDTRVNAMLATEHFKTTPRNKHGNKGFAADPRIVGVGFGVCLSRIHFLKILFTTRCGKLGDRTVSSYPHIPASALKTKVRMWSEQLHVWFWVLGSCILLKIWLMEGISALSWLRSGEHSLDDNVIYFLIAGIIRILYLALSLDSISLHHSQKWWVKGRTHVRSVSRAHDSSSRKIGSWN